MIKRFPRLLRTTLAGGVLFLVPIVVLVIVFGKALEVVQSVVAPLAGHLPVKSVIGLSTPKLLACALLVLVCFLAGVLARTALSKRVVNRLESSVLSNLPGYELIKSMGENMLGVQPSETRPVVLAHLGEGWQIGFLVERLDNGLLAVFLPDALDPRSGSVSFLHPDRVKIANLPALPTLKCLKRLGVGSNELIGKLLLEDTASRPGDLLAPNQGRN